VLCWSASIIRETNLASSGFDLSFFFFSFSFSFFLSFLLHHLFLGIETINGISSAVCGVFGNQTTALPNR
jgi:hypothetical protein